MSNKNPNDFSNVENHQESQASHLSNREVPMPNNTQPNQNVNQSENYTEEVNGAINFPSFESMTTNGNSVNNDNGLNENGYLPDDFNEYNHNYEGDDDEKINNFDINRININKSN